MIDIIVKCGQGGQGFSTPNSMKPTVCGDAFPSDSYSEPNYNQGVWVRICAQPLGCSFTLTGLKHLNRLENIWRELNGAMKILPSA